MNERIKELLYEAGGQYGGENHLTGKTRVYTDDVDYEKFAELIVRECIALNKTQSYDLMGVIADTEEGDGFDDVCLTTVKRVADYLGDNSLAKHFGVEE